MNDSNAKTMYETVPAAAELNKVPGFDPLKFLRRTKDTLKLDLPYQKLWFRMAHPNGRMRLTALRITEQMAIFEAKVFLDRSDAEPFSMSTAQQTTLRAFREHLAQYGGRIEQSVECELDGNYRPVKVRKNYETADLNRPVVVWLYTV